DFYRRNRLDMTDRITPANIEEARFQAGLTHAVENPGGALDAYPPVLGIAALRAHMKSNACKIGFKPHRFLDDAFDLGSMGSEFARQRPVTADIGRIDAQIHLCIRFHAR